MKDKIDYLKPLVESEEDYIEGDGELIVVGMLACFVSAAVTMGIIWFIIWETVY